ncbi:hypothetical protein H4S03_008894, partial [Coemansia sp. S3946]
ANDNDNGEKDYLIFLETNDDLGVDFEYPKKWIDVSEELKQSCLDFLKAQGYDVPDEYRLVFQLSGPKRYLLYGKGVSIYDADDCFDDNTEFLMLRMKNGIMRMVTKKKTLLRYRVYLLDRE